MNIKSSKSKKPAERGKKQPKKITSSYLHNSGLYYLQRYATSSNNFKEVMRRKALKSCQFHEDQNIDDCMTLIEALVSKFEETGLLNDEVYTRGVVASLRRQGKSRNAVMMKLVSKGIFKDLAKEKLEEYDLENNENNETAERNAALTFARKKRLGPFDKSEERDNKKSLAKMARAGFSFDTSRSVLNLNLDEAEDML